jgi:hypothetical protein
MYLSKLEKSLFLSKKFKQSTFLAILNKDIKLNIRHNNKISLKTIRVKIRVFNEITIRINFRLLDLIQRSN